MVYSCACVELQNRCEDGYYHLHCLNPPLSAPPQVEVWLCPQCEVPFSQNCSPGVRTQPSKRSEAASGNQDAGQGEHQAEQVDAIDEAEEGAEDASEGTNGEEEQDAEASNADGPMDEDEMPVMQDPEEEQQQEQDADVQELAEQSEVPMETAAPPSSEPVVTVDGATVLSSLASLLPSSLLKAPSFLQSVGVAAPSPPPPPPVMAPSALDSTTMGDSPSVSAS